MIAIEARQLRRQTGAILRQVREQGESFLIVDQGQVIARLEPADQAQPSQEEGAALLADLQRLAGEVGQWWPAGVSAVDAIREGRRDL